MLEKIVQLYITLVLFSEVCCLNVTRTVIPLLGLVMKDLTLATRGKLCSIGMDVNRKYWFP